jgi:O-antigen ligase
MTTKQRVAAGASQIPPSDAKVPWAPTTVLGSAVALALPFNQQLHSATRALWFACVVALIGIPMLVTRGGRRPLYPAVWVFAGYAAIVAILTATKEGTIDENLFVGSQLVLLVGFGPFAMTANALIDPKFVQRVSVAFLVGQFLSDIAAILQLLGISAVGSGPVQGRALGLAEHPDTFGLMSSLAILIALQFLLATRKFRLLVLVALGANIMALIASGTLSAMMALLMGLTVLIIARRDYVGKMALSGIVCAVILWLVGRFSGIFNYLPSVQQRYLEVTGQTKIASSWEGRTLTYQLAWSKIMDDPVYGVGLNFKYSQIFNDAAVHNVFLRAWYQGGIFLATAIALIVIAVLIVALRAMIKKVHGGEASVLVAIFAYALTSSYFEQRQFWLPVVVAWGSISAAAIKKRLPLASHRTGATEQNVQSQA